MLIASLPNITRPHRHVNSIYKVDFVENAQYEFIYKAGFIFIPYSGLEPENVSEWRRGLPGRPRLIVCSFHMLD